MPLVGTSWHRLVSTAPTVAVAVAIPSDAVVEPGDGGNEKGGCAELLDVVELAFGRDGHEMTSARTLRG